jgi:hypothetical protein
MVISGPARAGAVCEEPWDAFADSQALLTVGFEFPVADLAQLLLVLQEWEAGADDFARVVQAPGIELLLYEL